MSRWLSIRAVKSGHNSHSLHIGRWPSEAVDSPVPVGSPSAVRCRLTSLRQKAAGFNDDVHHLIIDIIDDGDNLKSIANF